MRLVVVVLSAWVVAAPAAAKDLYVDAASGNDSVSYEANGPNSPWRSLGRAVWGSESRTAPNGAEAAKAGDVVHVAAGTYSAPGTGGRFRPAFNPANSGTSGNPVQFVAEGTVALRLSSGNGPVIGSDGRNYVVWDGFYIDEAQAPPAQDTGPVTVFQATGVVIRNLQIKGIFAPWQDNHNGIRIEQANGTLVQGNLIYGIGSQSGLGQNDSAIMLYDSNDTVIENNELRDSGAGVFVKGQHSGFTQRRTIVRRNLISGMGAQGITVGPAARDGRTYQNIITACRSRAQAIRIYDLGAGEGREPINEVIANNTVYGCTGVYVMDVGTGVTVANNILDVTGTSGEYPISSVKTDMRGITFDRQVFNGAGGTVARLDIDGGGATYSLGSWQNAFGHERNGIVQSPGFIAPAQGNFRLGAGAAARTVGIDLLDLNGNGSTSDLIAAGAYVVGNEVIGRNGDGGPALPPAPTGLRIIPPPQ